MMSRQAIRQMKRVVTQGRHSEANEASIGLAKEASVRLLERSIRFGHTRLSVLRLAMAAQSGAEIPHECWDFCRRIASASKDANTQALFMEAVRTTSTSKSISAESSTQMG